MLRFQSTFPRGERRFLRGGSRLVSYFNPRSLVGNDVLRRAACPLLFYFNPRSLVGNDGNQNIRRNQNGNFNPRSLVGNDILKTIMTPVAVYFNPRSLVGNDAFQLSSDDVVVISIHVPSWGTTATASTYSLKNIYFNPRSLVGNDERIGAMQNDLFISIHVPSWGTTANFHKYSLFFYAINIIFLLFIIPSLFSLVLFMLLF